MLDKIVGLLMILVVGGLAVGIIGILMPIILFCLGFFGIALLILFFAKLVTG